jgi:hypothetical protein
LAAAFSPSFPSSLCLAILFFAKIRIFCFVFG